MSKVTVNHFEFPDHTTPKGALPRHKGAQACWYFYLMAQKIKERVGDSTEDQIILEGEQWMDKHYVQLARSVAFIYRLDSPDEFAKFWQFVTREAMDCGLPIPAQEYMRLSPRIVGIS